MPRHNDEIYVAHACYALLYWSEFNHRLIDRKGVIECFVETAG
jgi:hypothetical protein